jgi:hypothetical protein
VVVSRLLGAYRDQEVEISLAYSIVSTLYNKDILSLFSLQITLERTKVLVFTQKGKSI